MLLTALIVVIVAPLVSAEQTHLLGEPPNGEKIPIEISLKGHLVTVITGRPNPPQPFFTPTVNLYDLNKQLEARKVVENRVCYIRKFKGTYNQIKEAVHAAKAAKATARVAEEWDVPKKEIPAAELEATVGEDIAEFCSGYTVVWAKRNKQVTKMEVRMIRRVKPWNFNLGGNRYGAKGSLSYNNGRGFSANIGGGWSRGGGWSASAGLSWNFGK